MATSKARAEKAKPEVAPEITYGYGLRTWDADGRSHGTFQWDLAVGARTTAPDWKPRAECGNGLHCNQYGVGDWSLMGDLSEVASGDRVLGLVRYDASLAIDLDGKIKAPWMEIVLTTKTADLGSVLGAINPHRIEHIQGLTQVQETAAATTGDRSAAATTGYRSAAATTGYSSAAATTGDSSAAATTGYRSAAATTGYRSAAATTGYRSAAATTGYSSAAATTGDSSAAATTGDRSAAATTGDSSAAATTGYSSAAATTGDSSAAATTGDRSAAATTGDRSAAATTGDRSAAATTGDRSAAATTGKYSIAAALGTNGSAKAGLTGAIMLAAYGDWDGEGYPLIAVFAGMVGQTYGETTINPGVAYTLGPDGKPREVSHGDL